VNAGYARVPPVLAGAKSDNTLGVPKEESLPNAETTAIASRTRGSLRLSALCGMVAPIFFACMVLLEGFLVPSFSQVSQHISDLGVYALYGYYAILQNLNFWIFGILVVAFALGLGRSFPRSRAVTASLVLFGMMVFSAGLFPDEPFPFPGAVHGLVSIVAFNAVILCQFLAWLRLRHTGAEEESAWGRYRTYSLISGVLSFVLLTIASIPPESIAGVVITGLKQKAFLMVPWAWVGIMALRLFRLSNMQKTPR
jgi:hypothetical membrane protein